MGYPNTDQFIFSDEEVEQYNQARIQMEGLHMAGAPMEGGQPTAPPAGMPPMGPGGPPQGQDAQGGPPRHAQQPVAGNSPGRNQFMGARPPIPANGPGGSPMDMTGRPVG